MPDMIVSSMTASEEEIAHAVSADWRNPMPVAEPEVKKTEEPEQEVETEAAPVAPEETQEAETEPDSEPEEVQEKPTKGKGGFQKKIDKLTKDKAELSTKLSEYEDRFKAIEDRLAGKPAEKETEKPEVKTSEALAKPSESEIGTKYKDWNEYNEALIDWKADRKIEAKLAARDQSALERETKETQAARDEGYLETADAFAKTVPDFNDKVNAAIKAGMKLPEPILNKIKEMPNGPAITYHLVTHPEDALALVQMPIEDGFIALGQISYGLGEAKPQPKAPAKKSVSTAPPAVKPVTGNSAKSGSSLQELSARGTDEYVRARMAQMIERESARRY